MAEIDPQQFGRLQAQVETLIESDREKTDLLTKLSEDMTAIRLQLAEAQGGWKLLMLLGGGAAAIGGTLVAVAQKLFKVIGP
jgi:hypothetical protein